MFYRLNNYLTDVFRQALLDNRLGYAQAWFLYCSMLLCPEKCFFTNHSSSNACIMVLPKITFVFHSFLYYRECDDLR